MPSKVITGSDFGHEIDLGLDLARYKYKFLVEGDSWMDKSSILGGSLPWALAKQFDQAVGESALFINISTAGHTLQTIEQTMNGEFADWLKAFNWPFDAILFSAGGNDFIDAARDPDAGQGLLNDMANAPANPPPDDCLNLKAVWDLVHNQLAPCFERLYTKVRTSHQGQVPIFLNCYDVPTPRNAPAIPNGRSWLFEAFKKNHLPQQEALWKGVARQVFEDVEATVQGWTAGRSNIYAVPTRGTLTPAAWGSTGSNADWKNEIHPNPGGWDKLAKVWYTTMRPVLQAATGGLP